MIVKTWDFGTAGGTVSTLEWRVGEHETEMVGRESVKFIEQIADTLADAVVVFVRASVWRRGVWS